MKTAAHSQISFMARPIVPLPNVATRRQFLHKFLDRCLLIASALGFVAGVTFLTVIL